MDNERIAELLPASARSSIRRLFGGKGIYSDGVIFAIVLRGELDAEGRCRGGPDFAAAGLQSNGSMPNHKTGNPVRCPTGRSPTARSTIPTR